MAKDNTLGAPTEGLGQTVTFAFNPNTQIPQMDAGSLGRYNTSVQGGDAAGVQDASGVQAGKLDPTLEALVRFGDKILNKHIEKARTEAFVGGMQRAAAGEAVTAIAEEQPWYSKIFGDSDAVEGARAYTGQAQAQTAVSEMEDAMPELRKLGPDEARQFFVDKLNGALTGDAATDLTIMQATTRALPPLMRQQTKAHYAYQQETAAGAMLQSFQATAGVTQKIGSGRADGFTTDEEYAQAVQAQKLALVPPVGMNEKTYKATITAGHAARARAGDLYALDALFHKGGDDEPALFDLLEPKQQTEILNAQTAGEARARREFSTLNADLKAQIQVASHITDEGQTTQDLANMIDTANMRYQKSTGAKDMWINPEQRAAMLSRRQVDIAHANAKRVKADAKKAKISGDADVMKATALAAIANGDAGLFAKSGDMKEREFQRVAHEAYQASDPAGRVKMLSDGLRTDYTFDMVKAEITGGMNAALKAGAFTDTMQGTYELYVAVRENDPAAADVYFGKYRDELNAMYLDHKAGRKPEDTFAQHFMSPKGGPRLTEAEKKEALGTIESRANTILPSFLADHKLKPGQANRLLNSLDRDVASLSAADKDVSGAMARVLKVKQAEGAVDILAGYVWSRPKGTTSMTSYLNTPGPAGKSRPITDNIHSALNDAINEKVGLASAEDADNIQIDQVSDLNGVPRLRVQVQVDDKVIDTWLTGDEVFALSDKRNTTKKQQEDAQRVVPASTKLMQAAQRRLDKKE